MNSLLYAALGTGFTFLMTALGAGVVFCFRRPPSGRMKRIYLGFAAGVMAAATIWSLLLPAIGRAEEMGLPGWLPAAGGIVLGAAFLMLIEAGIARLSARRRMRLGSRALLLTAITLHNIPEGMAVGLSFALAVQSGSPALMAGAVSLALGIGVQNLPEGAAVALPLLDAGLPKRTAFAVGALSALVEPVFGVLAALAVTVARPLMPWLLGFAAGAMLLVTVRELIPEACGGAERVGTLSVLAGFLLMMILDVALG